jgi:hypothetical protein
MFQHGATGIGIACIVLSLCCGLGGLWTCVVATQHAGISFA